MKVIPGLILMSGTVVVEKLIKYTLPFLGSRLFLLFWDGPWAEGNLHEMLFCEILGMIIGDPWVGWTVHLAIDSPVYWTLQSGMKVKNLKGLDMLQQKK